MTTRAASRKQATGSGTTARLAVGLVRDRWLDRYADAAAGISIAALGIAVMALGI